MCPVSVDPAEKAVGTDQEVRELLADYFRAVEQHDLTRFLSFFLQDEHFTVVEDKETYDWTAFVAFAQGFFQAMAEIALQLETCAVDPLGSGGAVATGVFKGVGRMASGEPVAFRNAFTFVLIRQADEWRIKHVHESSL